MKRLKDVFSWLGAEKEKEVLEHAGEHMKKVLETVRSLRSAIKEMSSGDWSKRDELLHQVAENEHQADLIHRQLLRALVSGAIRAPDREDLMHLLNRMDDIADSAHAGERMLALLEKNLPDELWNDLNDFMELTVRQTERTRDAVVTLVKQRHAEVLDICTEIETMEEEGDDRKREFLKKILKDNLDTATLMVCHDLILALESITDMAEAVGDLLRVLVVETNA